MQSRGGLKGIDIDKELLGFEVRETASGEETAAGAGASSVPSSPLDMDAVAAAQREKNWKQKRERPPIDIAASVNADAPDLAGSPTHPAQLHLYPGMFRERINHNLHAAETPATKYDQEITYWNYIHPEILTALQNGRQGKVRLTTATRNRSERKRGELDPRLGIERLQLHSASVEASEQIELDLLLRMLQPHAAIEMCRTGCAPVRALHLD